MAGSDGRETIGETALLVASLARGLSYAATAEACGVSVRTVERRMADPAFRQQVSEALTQGLDDAARMLIADVSDAIETLRELRGEEASSKAGSATRLKASIATIELAERLTSQLSLQAQVMGRLGRLEKARLGS